MKLFIAVLCLILAAISCAPCSAQCAGGSCRLLPQLSPSRVNVQGRAEWRGRRLERVREWRILPWNR